MKYQVHECVASRLRGLSREVDRTYRRHLEGTDITESQLSIMLALSKTGKKEQIIIGRILNLERSSMSRNLNRLIGQGFILKQGPVNRPVISLTRSGMRKVRSLIPSWEKAMDEIKHTIGTKALLGLKEFEKGFRRK